MSKILRNTRETSSKLDLIYLLYVIIFYNYNTIKQNEINTDTLPVANLEVKVYSNFAHCSTIVLFLPEDPTQELTLVVFLWSISQFGLSDVSLWLNRRYAFWHEYFRSDDVYFSVNHVRIHYLFNINRYDSGWATSTSYVHIAMVCVNNHNIQRPCFPSLQSSNLWDFMIMYILYCLPSLNPTGLYVAFSCSHLPFF